jgi:peroxiredoxin
MKNKYFLIIAVLIASFACNYANTPQKVENFTLKNYDGREYSLKDFSDSKAIVVMFVSTQCPVSNDYNERMAKIYNNYKDKGIAFVGINSNKQESVEEITKHSGENNFGFPVLKDHKNIIADKFKASVTPEVYVLNDKLEVLYHGRIDDNRKADKVEVQDLPAALDEIIAGKSVSSAKTKAFGCTIKRVD